MTPPLTPRERNELTAKGTVKIVGMTRDGDWIVKPVGHGSIDVALASLKSGSLIEVKEHNPPTRKQKAMAKIGLKLVGAETETPA